MQIVLQGCPYTTMGLSQNDTPAPTPTPTSPRRSNSTCSATSPIKDYILSSKKQSSTKPVSKSLSKATGMSFIVGAEEANRESPDKSSAPPSKSRSKSPAKATSKSLSRATGKAMLKANNMSFENLDSSAFKVHRAYHAGISPSPSFSAPKSRSLSPEPVSQTASESKSNTLDSKIQRPSKNKTASIDSNTLDSRIQRLIEKKTSTIDSNKSDNSKPVSLTVDRGTSPKYRSKSADFLRSPEPSNSRALSPEPSHTSKSKMLSVEPSQSAPDKSKSISTESVNSSSKPRRLAQPKVYSKSLSKATGASFLKSSSMSNDDLSITVTKVPKVSYTGKSSSPATSTTPSKLKPPSPMSKGMSKSLGRASGVAFIKEADSMNNSSTKIPKISYTSTPPAELVPKPPTKVPKISYSKSYSEKHLTLPRVSSDSKIPVCNSENISIPSFSASTLNSPLKDMVISKDKLQHPVESKSNTPSSKGPISISRTASSPVISASTLNSPLKDMVISKDKLQHPVESKSNTPSSKGPISISRTASSPAISAATLNSPLKDMVISKDKLQHLVEIKSNTPSSKGLISISRTASSPAINSIIKRDPSPKPIVLKVEGPKISSNATSKENSPISIVSPRRDSAYPIPHVNTDRSSKTTNISVTDNSKSRIEMDPIYSSVYDSKHIKIVPPISMSFTEPIYAPVVRTCESLMDPIYSTIASTSFNEPLYSTPLKSASKTNSLNRKTSYESIYSTYSNTNIRRSNSLAVKTISETLNVSVGNNISNQNCAPIISKTSNPTSDQNNNSTYDTLYSTPINSCKQNDPVCIKVANEPVYSVNENNIKNQKHIDTKTIQNQNTSEKEIWSVIYNEAPSELNLSVKDIISRLDSQDNNNNKNIPNNNDYDYDYNTSIIAQLASELNVKIQTSPSCKIISSPPSVANLPYNQDIYGSIVDTASSKATIVTVSSAKSEGQITSVAPIPKQTTLKPTKLSNSPITSNIAPSSKITVPSSMPLSQSSQIIVSSFEASNSTASSISTVTSSSTSVSSSTPSVLSNNTLLVSSSTVTSNSTMTPKASTSMTSTTPVVSAAAAAPMASTCALTPPTTPLSSGTSGTTLAYATTIDFTDTVVYASTKPPGMGPPSSMILDIDSESFKGSSVCIPSDCDSDVDLMKTMKKNEPPLLDEEESEMDEDEDSDNDDDFKLHFPVHSGRKSSAESPKNTPDLLLQISELQEAVVEMKSSLTEAVTRLGSVVEEPLVAREVNEARTRCDNNTSEVLKLVLSLKTDITQLQTSVSAVADRQESLQNTVQTLLDDRRLLLQDLTQAGVVSLHTRSRLESGNILGVDDGGRAPIRGSQGSGSHSNDSGVALLLERAHHAFTADNNASPTPTNNRTSDQDSLPEQPSLLVPPSVYEYVAGLRNPATHSTPNSHAKNTHQDNSQNKSSLGEDSGCVVGGGDSEDLGLTYDSDSSLTIAANKTISLSASLSQQCGIELRTASTTADSRHNHGHHRNNRSAVPSMHNRSDSDGSDQSREAARHRHKRRSHEHDYLEQEGEYSDPFLSVDALGPYCLPIDAVGVESADPYTMVVTRSRPSTIDPREAQRYRVARELLDTEKKYCKTLWTIQDTFADPLKKAGILSHKDITTLFPEEVYQLYDKHCLLQHQLKERLASWKWQPMVGDIVARFTDPRHTDVLRLYTAYVNDFPEVLKTFHKLCRTSPPFTKFIKSCLEQPACGGLDLGAFLLTPVQRVPRYILLMKNLLKYTDPGHPDYQHLHACLERLRDFLARLNDSMEHSFQLVHAQLSHMTPGKNHHHSSAPNTVQRPSRSPRRSCSSISSPPVSPSSPSYSPDRSLCRSQTTSPERRQHSPSCSQKSFSSPHRSHSLAASQPPSCRPRSASRGRSAGDEGDYWDPASAAVTPDSLSSQVAASSLATMVGDFVDEEGNPCSNV